MLCLLCVFLTCVFTRLQYVVHEWAVWTCLSARAGILLLQIHTAPYKHLDLSHSATEINGDAHITVDRMSQCGN